MSTVTLMQVKGEARVDSRLLAEQLGNKHRSTIILIDRYADQLKRFGQLPFQMTAVKTCGTRGTKHHRHALLNEDQAFALLALSRNTDRVVELKVGLVMAFREARYGRACETLEARQKEASRSGSCLARWRYAKPGIYQHVASLREQLKLPIEQEGSTAA